jgi:hypothetical protein
VICRTKQKACKIDFSLSATKPKYIYVWKIDGKVVSDVRNPKSLTFPIGKHILVADVYTDA